MKVFLIVASTIFLAAGYDAAIPYFKQTRAVTIAAPEKQNYLLLDADIFKNARPELSDIRLFDGQSQVPYVLIKQSGGSSTQETQAKILNLGSVGGHTEFDLDTSGFAEYDRVRLQIEATDFINSSQVEGRRTLKDSSGTKLGFSTLYDFTKEGLGSNSTLKFPSASFPYLHVRLATGIYPDQVRGAYLSSFSETRAAWTAAGQCSANASPPKQSVYQCNILEGMPVERLAFALPAGVINFNRTVVLSDSNHTEFQRASISRVRMSRSGQAVTSEDLTIDLYGRVGQQITLTIENGDDPPLPLESIQPLAVERRLYFDPKGKAALQLYYGDPKLEPPTYDYAKFFQQSPDATMAQVGAAQSNPQYSGRPDDRPWTERNGYLLWIAMIVAVIVLGALALRGLKSGSSTAQ